MTECSYSLEHGILIRNMRAEDYLRETNDLMRKMKVRIEELENAIRQHRIDVWGDGKVNHCTDVDLYKMIGDLR